MINMHIVTLGTIQKGGIDSVIQGYIDNGLFDDVRHTRIVSHSGSGKWRDLYLFASASISLFFLCAKEKTVLLHCHMSYKGSFIRKVFFFGIAKLFCHKTIIHLHGSEFKDYFYSGSRFRKKTIVWLIKNVDEFVVLSGSWKDFIYEISQRKVVVINNYVDIEKVNRPRLKNQILFLGAFINRKGVFDLIRALEKLGAEYHLHLCGAGDDRGVESLINELGLFDQVTMHGWINKERKAQLLSECSVFILPSYNEGLPMVIIEAMACEIPIISTPVGGIPEVIVEGETGYIVEPGDVLGIAKKLKYVLSRDNVDVIAEAKKYYSENFSSKIVLPKWKSLYSSVLSE